MSEAGRSLIRPRGPERLQERGERHLPRTPSVRDGYDHAGRTCVNRNSDPRYPRSIYPALAISLVEPSSPSSDSCGYQNARANAFTSAGQFR
jgi:hypothetical protein